MFFTQEDYKRIEEWLSKRSVKDTAFKVADSLKDNDLVPIVQDSTNKTISAFEFACFVGITTGNFINVSNLYNKYCISLEEALSLIPKEGRKLGVIISFLNKEKQWVTYQFNSSNINNWCNTSYWTNTYDNVSKFKGIFFSEETLLSKIENPNIGDYAFVGEKMEDAVLYICEEESTWKNTNTLALQFADKFEALYSKDFSELEYSIDEQYSDRAEKDSLGRIIHLTYITREGLSKYVFEQVSKAVSESKAPIDSVSIESLDDSVKQYIGSSGEVTNFPDGEDLTSEDNNGIDVLKLADKSYSPINFSGLGRKYLRKNMTDGINVLEQYMISEPNTIYTIQYDYCLNGATIVIPENCTLKFEGGTLNGGTIVCNNTKFLNIFSFNEIGNATISDSSTFAEGQIMYDTEDKVLMYYNGISWKTLSVSEPTKDPNKDPSIPSGSEDEDQENKEEETGPSGEVSGGETIEDENLNTEGQLNN